MLPSNVMYIKEWLLIVREGSCMLVHTKYITFVGAQPGRIAV